VENKKELIVRTQKIGNYEIIYEGGGEIPHSLSGSWNKKKLAYDAIERHIASQRRKEEEVRAKAEAKEIADKALAKMNRDAIKAKSKAKKTAKGKVEKVDGEGQAGV
jgi:hypothetical protein